MGVIRHPARHYIHYLLSRRIYSTKGVIEEMGKLGLPVPKNLYAESEKPRRQWPNSYDETDFAVLCTDVLKVRQLMEFPANFEPQKKRPNEATRLFLEQWRIGAFWRMDTAVGHALALMTDAPIQSALELYLLSPLGYGEIARRLCARFALEPSVMNAAVVRAFGHYFWDSTALTPQQWKLFTSEYRPGEVDQFHALLEAPRNEAGAAQAIGIIDHDFPLLPAVQRYEAVSAMMFSVFMRQAQSRSPGAAYAAYAAINAMRVADDEIEKHQGGTSDLIAEFQRIRVLHDQQAPMKITDAPFVQRPPLLLVKNEEPVDDG